MIDQGLRQPDKKNGKGFYFAYGGDFGEKVHDRQFCCNVSSVLHLLPHVQKSRLVSVLASLPYLIKLRRQQGLFSPDREPHPSVTECKYLMQPVEISQPVPATDKTIRLAISKTSSGDITLKFKNRYVFQDLSHLAWTWELISNRSTEPVATGSMALLGDMECEIVSINMDDSIEKIRNLENTKTTKLGNSYYLNIRGALHDATVWAEAGHTLVTEQFPVEFFFDKQTMATEKSWVFGPVGQTTSLAVSQNKSRIIVSRQIGKDVNPHVEICKKTGAIVSILSPKGDNLLAPNHSMVPQYTRATTDNDRGGMELMLSFHFPDSGLDKVWTKVYGVATYSYQFRWNMVGLNQTKPPRLDCQGTTVQDTPDNHKVTVEATLSITRHDNNQKELIRQKIVYVVYMDGRILVSTHVMPRRALKECLSLPRVGMSLALDKSLYHIQYFGRGPVENYDDRKAAAHMGVHETTPKDMAYHYIFPSENGNRSDCEWVALRNARGEGVCFAADGHTAAGSRSSFHFSAQLHNTSELHEATHTCDLEHRENGEHPVFVNLDHKLMGVGGDVRYVHMVRSIFFRHCMDMSPCHILIPAYCCDLSNPSSVASFFHCIVLN